MKIIISPSKSMEIKKLDYKNNEIKYLNKTKKLFSIVSKYSKDELSKLFKIKGKVLENTTNIYHKPSKKVGHAISSYTGLVFKGLDLDSYEIGELDYINDNLIILSALYGDLNPFSIIQEYRLDMTIKPDNINLYKYWDDVNLQNEELIINLSSDEFGKMIKSDKIDIIFNELIDDKYISKATYSKKMRGIILNYMIINKIYCVEDIKLFTGLGYKYNEELSNKGKIVFTK